MIVGEGMLFILVGPSGSGKSSIARALLKQIPRSANLVNATSRPRRPGEIDGEDYFFISKERFEALIKEGALLEWVETYGHFYGTLQRELIEKCGKFKVVISIHEPRGAKVITERFENAVSIFIAADNWEILEERVRQRQTETNDINQRILSQSAEEFAGREICRHVVINRHNDFAQTLRDVKKIIDEYLR